jgi:hypothetical protein
MKRIAAINLRSEDGQAVLLVVVAMSLLLFGALGLAIDGGQMYAQRQMAQTAADAAAQAGILSIFTATYATSAHPFGSGASLVGPAVCTTTDLRTPCVYARDNGFGGTAADTVTLSFPATVSGVTLSSVTAPAFAVTVQRTLQTSLIRFIPGAPSTSIIKAKATAGLVGAVSGDCVYVLDPSAQDAFLANNGATVTVSGCAIAVDSTASHGASIYGGATVTAPALNVVSGDVCSGCVGNPTLVTGAATLDPFASSPAAATPPYSCATHPSMYNAVNNAIIQPGTYCGGITVSNGVSGVTFAAGTYIIDGGGLTVGGGITTSGSGLMFYLTGDATRPYASVNIANGANVTFSGPTSGTYLGVLFFQDRTIASSSNATFAGGATMKLTGSLYFPTTYVLFNNGSSAEANSTAIVAKQVSFAGGTNIKFDPTGLQTGLFSKAVALVQ